MTKLYGDGIHDDTLALQELLDTKNALVELPVPQNFYLISKTLKIHSYQELRLPRYCRIKLAANSNCRMISNADTDNGNEHITISGGIWDYNNLEQEKNPQIFTSNFSSADGTPTAFKPNPTFYDGFSLYFYNVKYLNLKDLTLKDPVTFACTIDTVSYFTIENIVFDFNHGNPYPVNMDGIHINGNCHFGTIRNLKGATYDDLVALNADEGSNGPITHIDIDGLYAERCQTFIRLLTVRNRVEHIHIHNLFGTCFMYGIGLTKYYKGETTGCFDAITLDNINISRGEPVIDPRYPRRGLDTFAMISIESETVTKSLHISDMHRNEKVLAVPTIEIQKNTTVENLTLENCSDTSDMEFPFVKNNGDVGKLYMLNVRSTAGEVWVGNEPKETKAKF